MTTIRSTLSAGSHRLFKCDLVNYKVELIDPLRRSNFKESPNRVFPSYSEYNRLREGLKRKARLKNVSFQEYLLVQDSMVKKYLSAQERYNLERGNMFTRLEKSRPSWVGLDSAKKFAAPENSESRTLGGLFSCTEKNAFELVQRVALENQLKSEKAIAHLRAELKTAQSGQTMVQLKAELEDTKEALVLLARVKAAELLFAKPESKDSKVPDINPPEKVVVTEVAEPQAEPEVLLTKSSKLPAPSKAKRGKRGVNKSITRTAPTLVKPEDFELPTRYAARRAQGQTATPVIDSQRESALKRFNRMKGNPNYMLGFTALSSGILDLSEIDEDEP